MESGDAKKLKHLVSRPGDFVNADSSLRVGIGPTERPRGFGIHADVLA